MITHDKVRGKGQRQQQLTMMTAMMTKPKKKKTEVSGGGGGGGGFFLACEDSRRMFDHLFTACAFLKLEIRSLTLISTVYYQDQSTVTQRAETTVAECSLTSYI